MGRLRSPQRNLEVSLMKFCLQKLGGCPSAVCKTKLCLHGPAWVCGPWQSPSCGCAWVHARWRKRAGLAQPVQAFAACPFGNGRRSGAALFPSVFFPKRMRAGVASAALGAACLPCQPACLR